MSSSSPAILSRHSSRSSLSRTATSFILSFSASAVVSLNKKTGKDKTDTIVAGLFLNAEHSYNIYLTKKRQRVNFKQSQF